jgi:hypothetical protein
MSNSGMRYGKEGTLVTVGLNDVHMPSRADSSDKDVIEF